LEKQTSFLDKISFWSLKGLISIGITAWIAMILFVVYDVLTDDPIIGYTEHGIPVLESEVENNE